MGALPAIKRFLTEDYPTEASWIGTLLYPLNLLLTTIYSNLNNGLTISQNMQAQVVSSISVSGQSASTSFAWNYSKLGAPIGVQLVQCLQGSTPIPIPQITWSYSAGTISISNISGLQAGSSYLCTFIVWGG